MVTEFYIVTCVCKSTKRSQGDGKYRAGAKIPALHCCLIIKALVGFILILDYQVLLYKTPINLRTSTLSPKHSLHGEKVVALISVFVLLLELSFLCLVWKGAGGPRFHPWNHSALPHGAERRFPRRTRVAWAGTGNRCLCSTMWEVWI